MKNLRGLAYSQWIVASAFIFLFGLAACDRNGSQQTTEQTQTQDIPLIKAPSFNADSAYAFVEKQVNFGPRVPNTQGHVQCGDYLIAKLKGYGAQVTVQSFVATAFDGKKLQSRNIIAAINPNAVKRILLAAHWDTRPFADQDSTRKTEPIAGANDGGSGVGVLLEVARSIARDSALKVGVDIIFFDSEDYGEPEYLESKDNSKSWYCLGSQYWAANKHKPNYSAYYGILLDMVGAKDAHFAKEGQSVEYAGSVVNNVWGIANRIGYGKYFIDQLSPGITDDHYFINSVAKIPTIDIIDYNLKGPNYFGTYWHTHNDNMSAVDRNTLKAVGQTVLQTVYQEE